jgi:hypothetical protein
MITNIEAGRTFFVEGHEPRLIEEDLNTAVEAARLHAMQDGKYGILVTRHDNTTFTVAISATVPYGETWERQAPVAEPQPTS